MLGLFQIFFNFFKKIIGTDQTIIVHRLPPRKVLRAHQLGLTAGLSLVIMIVCLYYKPIFNLLPLYTAPLFVLIFIVGTFWISPFTLLVFLYWIICKDVQGALWTLSQWFLVGYILGGALALLYNDLVYLHLLIFRQDLVKIAFAFDPEKRLNVIKSPIETEEVALCRILGPLNFFTHIIRNTEESQVAAIKKEVNSIESSIRKAYKKISDQSDDKGKLLRLLKCASPDQFDDKMKELVQKLEAKDNETLEAIDTEFEPLVEKYLKTRKQKLYNYQINTAALHPYTIVFVANPKVETVAGSDPIMQDRNLFLRSVEKALFSFERNEVLGRPEIWSRVRVITIFDQVLDCALVEPLYHQLAINGEIAENIATPTTEIWTDYQQYILPNADSEDYISYQLLNKDTDVIFAITGSKEYTRSSAIFSDYGAGRVDPCANGTGFKFYLDPFRSKNDEIFLPTCVDEYERLFEATHELYKEEIPGRVALNALDANLKTYIHEFAHAMSSYYHGKIVDEYFDQVQIVEDPANEADAEEPDFIPVCVNRIERSEPANGKVIPVHNIFAKYQDTIYCSDREHPSAEEDWIGYFPDRKTPFASCTMDRNYGIYRFDQLLCDFMYDRLIAKINR